MSGFTLINGTLHPKETATIPASDRGFRFGDGVFETIPLFNGRPYQWDFHRQRLQDGLAAVEIPFDITPLAAYARDLLAAQPENPDAVNGSLRIAISRGSGSRGYLPAAGTTPTLVMEVQPRPPVTEPVDLWLSSLRKIPPACLPGGLKLAQGLNSTLARMEAVNHGCFEALLLTLEGFICEGSSSHIFWFMGERLVTPSLATGCLRGSTREAILRVSPYPVREGTFSLNILEGAEAVFLANAAWQIVPVAQFLPFGMRWPTEHPQVITLQKALQEDIETNIHAFTWPE